ncbi:Transcription factor IIIC subunit 5 [Penicillium paradoxum]|uniref:Transcription factor IIIC subunit 5 n=1 Tax=Penicillium paradoxum TaxID=176176 RepID=UPI00254866EA|nr:Transcription factor IIIC subunit 5 [Penicillium paradoxum]KAJ5793418.1 Transcription factor IIIC subunit 5 [Penicillium paradoxum]
MFPRTSGKLIQPPKSHEDDVDFHRRETGLAKNSPAIGKIHSVKESGISDAKKYIVYGKDMIFTGITVSMRRMAVPQEGDCDKFKHGVNDSLEATVHEIKQLLDRRPVVTVRVLLDRMNSTSRMDIERALPLCGYMFEHGPWKKALIKFGVDPRAGSEFRYYQTVTFEMDFNPIAERGGTDWEKSGELAFPQLLRGDDNISHVFNGRKFVPDDNSWQICDISDVLLRGIVATSDIRSAATVNDGFFWNGTMAKLEVIMRDKLVCMRDGSIPDDEDYACLLSFPEKYRPPTGRDYFKYGLEFGQQCTQKQIYLRGRIVSRARRAAH